MSEEKEVKVVRKFCDEVQEEVILTISTISVFTGSPRQKIVQHVAKIRCDHENENCPSECRMKSQIIKRCTWK